MLALSVNTFTNSNGERVTQAFNGGLVLTREHPVGDPAPYFAAQEAFDNHNGHATLARWSMEDGEQVISTK